MWSERTCECDKRRSGQRQMETIDLLLCPVTGKAERRKEKQQQKLQQAKKEKEDHKT